MVNRALIIVAGLLGIVICLVYLAIAFILLGDQTRQFTPEPTVTSTATPSPRPTFTATPTRPRATNTPYATSTPEPTDTPAPIPSATPAAPVPTMVPTMVPTTVPTSTPTAATTATPQVRIHVVRAGETLAIIARKYATTATAIARYNGLNNPNRIYVGQRLFIP